MRQLKQPIEYRVELIQTAIDFKMCYPQSGTLVHVLRVKLTLSSPNGFTHNLIAIPPHDHHNYSRFMGMPGSTLVGVGRLIESVGTEWMVAWRPFSPAPELVPLED